MLVPFSGPPYRFEAGLQDSLVTVSPEEVLGADVLVGVLSALLKWLHVGPVLPMLVPEDVGVSSGDDQAWGDGAANGQQFILQMLSSFSASIGVVEASFIHNV